MKPARAILWAHWRTLLNFYPRAGVAWTAIVAFLWYGFWLAAAVSAGRLASSASNLGFIKTVLPGALFVIFLYWQVVPLLMAATGAALDLRKLQAYPIPVSELFGIEVVLRVTAAIEMVVVVCGIAIGIELNPAFRWWCALAFAPFVLFNLFLAVGLRDLLMRAMARRGVREVLVFVLVMCTALPQILLMRGPAGSRVLAVFAKQAWIGWPWSAASSWAQGNDFLKGAAILAGWTIVAALFGRWQFHSSLGFDQDAVASSGTREHRGLPLAERFFRLPSTIFADPLAALVEKEIRFLVRSPRFRLVFLMGFTFGIVILTVSFGRGTFFGADYLTAVSVYSLLLLSESCFWNSFGFDRSAAQIYFLAPVPFSRVLIGKNLSAIFFISLEISAVTVVCKLMGLPVDARHVVEAFAVASVVTIFLLCAGNLLSIHQARGVNPTTQFRANAAGRVQAMLVVIYPVAFIPVALAYLARWAFPDEWSLWGFFGVLAFDAVVGLVIYRIALESAVAAAERMKEKMIVALSAGDGPIAS
jgi:ABC-2 type transport system permease protein